MNAKMNVTPDIAVGNVLALFVSIKGEPKRHNKSTLELETGGVVGDKFHGREIARSVLIASTDSYRLAEDHNIAVTYGELGENILLDYNPYHLLPGTQIRIGEVLLEISQHCTLCKSLSKIDSALPRLLKADRGVFAKVITGGVITEGNEVVVA